MSLESTKQDDLRLEQQRQKQANSAESPFADLRKPKAEELKEADKQSFEKPDRQHSLSGEQAVDLVAQERYKRQMRKQQGDAPSLGGMSSDDNGNEKSLDLSKNEIDEISRRIAEVERDKQALEIKKQDEEAKARAEEILRRFS